MKRPLAFLPLGILLLAPPAPGAELSGNGTTLIQFHQRDMAGGTRTWAPVTQYVRLDAAGVGHERLSLHLAGWGRADLADQSQPNGTSSGFLDYGYLQYLHPTANAQVQLGRIITMETGWMEQMDGILLRSDLLQKYKGLSASLFAGRPVSQGKGTNVRGDILYGGRASYRIEGVMEAGAFFVQESGMLRTGPTSDLKDYRAWVGGDLFLSPLDTLTIDARTLYDDVSGEFAEHRVRGTLAATKDLTLSVEYRQHRLDALFSSTNLRTLFSPDRPESESVVSASLTYRFPLPLDLTLEGATIDRENRSSGSRVGLTGRSTIGNTTWGGSYHHVTSGDLKQGSEGFAPPDYDEMRLFALYRKESFTLGGDILLDLFSSTVASKKRSVETTLTGGYQISRPIRLSLDLTHADTPLVDNELRALARLSMSFE